VIPVDFEGSNCTFGPPEGMSEEECRTLNAFKGQDAHGRDVVIECWQLSDEEVIKLLETGRVWVIIASEHVPPLALTTEAPAVRMPGSE